MRAPLARSLSEIVELSPFEATRPKVFDLVSIFLFLGGLSSFQSFRPPHLSLDYFQQVSKGGESRICFKNCNSRSVTEVLNDQSLTFQKMRSHFTTGFLRQSTKSTVLNLLRFTLSSLFR